MFLCSDEWELDWFVRMNNTGGPVDVWAVDGCDPDSLVDADNGHSYFPGAIPPEALTLLRRDVAPVPEPH